MNTTKQLLCAGCFLWLGATAQAQDDSNLINITTIEQLNAVRYDLDGDGAPDAANAMAYSAAFGTPSCVSTGCSGYELMTDLDFAGSKWASDCASGSCLEADGSEDGTSATVGWDPIGDTALTGLDFNTPNSSPRYSLTAVFDGNEHMISNLYINRSFSGDQIGIGLFSSLGADGEVRDLNLVGSSVMGRTTSNNYPNIYVGELVGLNGGMIIACSAAGNITANANSSGSNYFTYAGVLVGMNFGTITVCSATGNANANSTVPYAGGLVGGNGFYGGTGGTITACYATGNATATGRGGTAGGLVGQNYRGAITACYATGNANTTGSSEGAGGLAGANHATIIACYATGDVTGNGAGGLVGNSNGGRIIACYATGNATAGGLVGLGSGTVDNSYFDYQVSSRPSTDLYAKTTHSLQSPTDHSGIYVNWDQSRTWEEGGSELYIWALCGTDEYPKLNVDFDGDNMPSVAEFGAQGNCAETPSTPGSGGGNTGAEGRMRSIEMRNTNQSDSLRTHNSKITTLETGKAVLEARNTNQSDSLRTHNSKITTLETGKAVLEARNTNQSDSLRTHNSKIIALEAKIKAFEAALAAAGVALPGGTSQPSAASTMIYNVPAASGDAQVYPNPAARRLQFANLAPGSYTYKIYTSSGQQQLLGSVQSDSSVDISVLEDGQYILVLQDADGTEILHSSLLVE